MRDGNIKYLFLDVEWYQHYRNGNSNNNEITQLSVIAVDEKLQIISNFYNIIKLNICKSTDKNSCCLNGITEENLMTAPTIDECLKMFFEEYSNYENIVIWNKNAYDIFVKTVENLGYTLPKHNVLILQDFFKTNFKCSKKNKGCLGFNSILTKMNVDYNDKKLHIAEYDTELLFILFKKAYKRCKAVCKENEFTNAKGSKVLHYTDCKFANKINSENRQSLNRIELLNGFKVCKECLKSNKIKRIGFLNPIVKTTVEELNNDDYIINTCKFFNVNYHIGEGVVFINTNFSRWIIYIDNHNVKSVFHENSRPSNGFFHKKSRSKLNAGFHNQKLHSQSFFNVVKYIKCHDDNKYLVKNPLSKVN